MKVDRRTAMAGAAAALLSVPALAQRHSAQGSWYDRAIIIDALGGMNDPYSPQEQLRLSDRSWVR